ncbi:hypothetical protein KIH27_21395 [Mycobacterium sp. M1]|uniref:PE family protein n=1 Tax=Mycolicibacter acidiphilus TaxID=2835306 RepID=A0ABS5RPC8_9MYCO|nr:hypothetical protein [Mycolicibacter acidiphilus]MBS9536143.1 hypothetical protein [Mycolicibacter acidiphilus]
MSADANHVISMESAGLAAATAQEAGATQSTAAQSASPELGTAGAGLDPVSALIMAEMAQWSAYDEEIAAVSAALGLKLGTASATTVADGTATEEQNAANVQAIGPTLLA